MFIDYVFQFQTFVGEKLCFFFQFLIQAGQWEMIAIKRVTDT